MIKLNDIVVTANNDGPIVNGNPVNTPGGVVKIDNNGYIPEQLIDQTTINNKVDKINGKGLSTEDYTTAEQTKLSGVETGAQVNTIESISVDNSALTITNKSVNIDLSGKVDKVNGKGLSTEDYTTAEQTKLSGVETGAQVNIIEDIKVNNTSLNVSNKSVDITIPTKITDLTNDSDFVIQEEGKGLSTEDYTTAEQTKLSGIETGAQVNTIESISVDNSTLTITNKSVNIDLSGKVDKVNGKGLSTEDYTTAEQTKLGGIETGAQVNIIEDVKVNNTSLTITNKSIDITIPTKITDLTNDSDFVIQEEGKGLSTNDYTDAEQTKLSGIETGAQVNIIESISVDNSALTITNKSVNIDLSNKADVSDIPTNSDFTLAGLSEKSYNSLTDKPDLTLKADLVNGIIPANQLPSYVDDVIEGYIDLENNKFYSDSNKTEEITVESGKIYIDLESSLQYRFGGSTFAIISPSLALGESADTAFPGNRGKALEDNKVDKVNGKGLSTEDYTTAEQTKLSGIETGAQVNTIESISVDNSTLTINNKSVNIDLSGKVDKVNGKDLSTNDYTDTEKNKLTSIESNAQVNIIESISVDNTTLTITNKSVNIDLTGKVDKVEGKGLSTEDYTTAEQTKLSGVETGAQVNIIEDIKVNNTSLNVSNKSVDITIPTKITDLTNDSDFVIQEEGKGLSTEDYTTAEQTKLSGIETGAQVNTIESISVDNSTLTITNKSVNIDLSGKVDKVNGKGLSTEDYTTAEQTKLGGIETGAQVNIIEDVKVNNTSLTITNKSIDITIPTKITDLTNDSDFVIQEEGKGLSTNDYTDAEQTKLSGIETGAQVNIIESISVDNSALTITNKSVNIDLSNKADVSDIPTNSDFTLAGLSEKSYNSLTDKPDLTLKADLVNGIIPANQLPSYVDDVIEGYIDLENNKFYSDSNKTEEITVESGKIYIDLESSLQYRFGGSTFAIISPSLALGESADTAFPGNRGKALEDNKVDKVNGKGLSTEDYTTAEQTKLSGIETGAQVNTIESISVDNSTLTINNKSVNIDLSGKVDKVNGKDLSTNDYTDTEKNKLTSIESNAQVNIIESISVDNTTLTITNKSVNIDLSNKANVSDIPTNSDFTLADLSEKSYNSLTDKPIIPSKTSDLTNDSGFIRSNDIANIGLKNIPITSNNATTDDYSIAWNNDVVTITHNLNSRVIGALYNTDNEQIFIGINYINNNSISIDFSDITLTNNDQFTLLLTAQQSVIGNIPTKVSDLTNDSNFVTSSQVSDMINGKLDAPSVGNCTNIRCLTQGTSVRIKWTDPSDLIIDNFTLAVWNSTVLVRKVGSYPTDVNDGTVIITSSVRNQYNNTAYTDTIPDSEVTYYYQLFPKTTQNVYNNNIENRFETSSLNWNTIHDVIQNGQAQSVLSIGDVLTTNHETYGEIQWQVVAFDQAETVDTSIQHSVTLLSLNCLGTRIFDSSEDSGAPNDRNQFGYNKWSESNIRQWLNSNGSANNWFVPQNEYDLCSYSNIDGFMKGFTDSSFLNCLTTTKNTTALNNVDAGGGSEITEDTFFLPSIKEINGSNNNNIAEGVYWSETFPDQNSRIKYNNNSASNWWLRSSPTGKAYDSYCVNSTGLLNGSTAYASYGLVPACVVK